MSTDRTERAAPGVGDRLDRLLARWADAHRVSARQAEALRRRVIAEPATDDFDWWWRLLDPDGGAAFRGLGAVAGWGTSPATPAAPTTVWPAAASVLPTWDHELPDFQPYLRLT